MPRHKMSYAGRRGLQGADTQTMPVHMHPAPIQSQSTSSIKRGSVFIGNSSAVSLRPQSDRGLSGLRLYPDESARQDRQGREPAGGLATAWRVHSLGPHSDRTRVLLRLNTPSKLDRKTSQCVGLACLFLQASWMRSAVTFLRHFSLPEHCVGQGGHCGLLTTCARPHPGAVSLL